MISALSRIACLRPSTKRRSSFPAFLDIVLGVLLDRHGEPVVARDRRVVFEHVQDQRFLDRLLHALVARRQVDLVALAFVVAGSGVPDAAQLLVVGARA